MKIIYEKQSHSRYHSGLQKLSLLLVMMLFGLTTAFGQTLTSNSPVSYNGTLVLTFNLGSCTGVTSVTFTGPGGFSVVDDISPFSVTRSGMLPNATFVGGYTATINGGTCAGNIYSTNVCVLPEKPVIAGTLKACVDEVTTYTTPIIGGNVYTWSVSSSSHALVIGGGQNAGVDYVSIQWLAGAVGNSAWVRVTAANACGGTQSDISFVNVYHNPITPTLTPALSHYCHGDNGVSLTVGNVQAGNDYYLYTFPGEILVDSKLNLPSNADFTFDNVKVDNDANVTQEETDFRVVAVNPNVCFNQSTVVKVIKFAEPQVEMIINTISVPYNYSVSYCYDELMSIELGAEMVPGSYPLQSIVWDVTFDGNPSLLSGSAAGVGAGFDFNFHTATLPAGVYVLTLTDLKDAHGCTPTNLGQYNATITINAEPTLVITVAGSPVIGTTLEYCYDDNIEFTVAGGDGIERWTFDWQVNDDLGALVPGFSFTGDWVDNTPEFKSFPASTLGPGTYKVLVTALSDGNNCNASPATIATYYIDLIIHPEPQADIVINGSSVGWNYNETFCFDQQMSFALGATMVTGAYPLQSITWTVSPEVPGIGLVGGTETSVGANFDFNFTPNQLPAGSYVFNITELTDANGCSPSSYAPYQANITIFPEPTLAIDVVDASMNVLTPPYAFCYDGAFGISIAGADGTGPWTFGYKISGPNLFEETGTLSGMSGVVAVDLTDGYDPGIYTFEITSLSDVNCTATAATIGAYEFDVEVYEEPTLTINVVDASMNVLTPPYAFCYDGAFGISIAGDGGTGPWTFDYKISGPNLFVETGTLSGMSGVVAVDLTDGYDPGTYTFEITSLSDVHCSASAATIGTYEFDVEVNAEPTIDVTIGGNSIFGTTQEYCYDDNIDFIIAGGDGIATWTFDWQVEYAAGGVVSGFLFTGDWVSTPENKSFLASALVPGDYVVRITSLVDGNGCVASPATIANYWLNLTINPEPTLLVTIGGNSILGTDLEYCSDDNIEFTIAGGDGIATWTFDWQVEYALGGVVPGFQFTGDWVITPENKSFLASALTAGDYVVRITSLVDGNGCVASPATIANYWLNLTVDELPVANAGIDQTICNALTATLDATLSVVGATGKWTLKTPAPGTVTFSNDEANNSTATVTDYGKYTFVWTETNGLCEDSDEVTVFFLKADATISGDAGAFSGETKNYSAAGTEGAGSFTVVYTWSTTAGTITNTAANPMEISFDYPLTGTVTLTVKVDIFDGVVLVCSDTKTFEVEVHPNVLAGQVKYYNSQESPMPSPFMMDVLGNQFPAYFIVKLFEDGIEPVRDSVMVQEIYGEENALLDDDVYEAAFMFDYNLDPSKEYYVEVLDAESIFGGGYWTMNNWGGVTAVDALFVQHMAAGSQINGFPNMSHIGANNLTPAYGFFANGVGDVNSSGGFSALDALLTSRRAVGLIPFFTNNTPNFRVAGKFVDEADFNTPSVFGNVLPNIEFQRTWVLSPYASEYRSELLVALNAGVHFLNIYYNATGDVNSSYVPAYGGFKAAPVMDLIFEGEIAATVGQEVTLPITLDNYARLGAMGLGLNYRNDLIEVIGTSYGEDFARIDHTNGTVAIAWADINGVSFDVDDAIVQLTVRILKPIAPGTRLYELNGFTELAEVDATIIEDVNFKSIGLNTSGVNGDFTTNVYPNPFNQQSVISYTLPEAGKVNVTIFNKLGQVVKTIVSENQAAGQYQVNVNSTDLSGPGMYYYKVDFDGETQHLSATNNMILIR